MSRELDALAAGIELDNLDEGRKGGLVAGLLLKAMDQDRLTMPIEDYLGVARLDEADSIPS